MDLNDPRRRLQVAKASNPSLRLAASPQQKPITLAYQRPQGIALNYTTPVTSVASFSQQVPTPRFAAQQPAQQPRTGLELAQAQPVSQPVQKPAQRSILDIFKPVSKGGINIFADAGNFVKDAFVKPAAEFAGKAGNTAGVVAQGLPFAVDRAIREATGTASDPAYQQRAAATEQQLNDMLKNSFVSQNVASGKANPAEFGKEFTKTGVEGASYALPGARLAQGAKLATRLATNAGANAAIGGGSEALNEALDTGKVNPLQVAISAGASGVLGLAGARGDKAVSNLAKSIAKETDPAVIKQALGVDDTIAEYLTNETSKKTVEKVIKQLAVDPSLNVPDNLRQRLQDEGITAVNKKDNPYGAEYNPSDRSINVKDQSFITEDNFNHEIGHDIFKNKLTPEERSLFADVNGPGRQQAVGRAGYTTEDAISEDFSNMVKTAMRDGIDSVPEKYRGVISKYVTVAQKEVAKKTGTPVIQPTKSLDGTVLPQADNAALPDELSQLKQEQASLSNAQDPRAQEIQNKINEIEAKSSGVDSAPAQPPEQAIAEGIQKTQTGTADGTITPSGEPTQDFGGKTAKDILPQGSDEATQKAVQDIMDSLNTAAKDYRTVEKTRAQEKAARIAAGDAAYEAAGGGIAGSRAKLAALGGQYSESGFVPINASPEVQKTILDTIQTSDLRPFEKLNVQTAVNKIWGEAKGKPTPGDINNIRKFFGEDMANAVEDAIDAGGKNWRDRLADIAGIPRAAMASFDFSMGLRQGGQVAVSHFPTWLRAQRESVRYATSPEYFQKSMKEMANSDYYEAITDKLKIRLPAVEGVSDEVMASAHMLEKIPTKVGELYGKGIAASDRAYSGGLSKLRFDLGKQWIDSLGGIDKVTKELSDKELRDMGEVLNTSTGSGGMKGGFTEQHMKTLSTTLFAPRLWASRVNVINPAYYARLSPAARVEALKNITSYVAAAASVVGLAKMAGADVEGDPRSADFMKIKVGNTRFDIFGGLQQNIVFAARMATGEKKNSTNGEIATLGEGYGKPDRIDLAVDMLQNKLNPALGYLARMLQTSDNKASDNPLDRKDKFGQDTNVAVEGGKLGVPLNVQSTVDTYNDTGNPVASLAANVPAFFGLGVQTYGQSKTKDTTTSSNGTKEYKGEVTSDMVVGVDGKPFLDKNGNPVKVKLDKGATDLEKQALLDEKQRSESRKLFVSKQSKEDQALMKLSATELADYVDEGKLDQAKADHILRLKKGAEDYNQPIKTPKGANSDYAKGFYQKFNSMTAKDQKAWLDQKPDSNSTALTQKLNSERPKGLDEFKPSNKLAKLYAEYEKTINTKEIDDFTREEKTRAFQKEAYKLNFGKRPGQIYDEGGSNDLKQKIDNGEISKADLDAALKMDADMYGAGVTSSLKFSKKFRNTYGYSTPAGAGGSGTGGRSGGKSAQLASLMPSFAKTPEAPKISSKRRTTGISFKNVNAPTKSTSKKVSINL